MRRGPTGDPPPPGPRRVPAHRPLRRGDLDWFEHERERTSTRKFSEQTAATRRSLGCATGRTRTRERRTTPRRVGSTCSRRGEAAGQGPLLQQPGRPGRRPHAARRAGGPGAQAAVIVKHANPCGAAAASRRRTPTEGPCFRPAVRLRRRRGAWQRGRRGARRRNIRRVHGGTRRPELTEEAKEILAAKPNTRYSSRARARSRFSAKRSRAEICCRTRTGSRTIRATRWSPEARPSPEQMVDLLFVWLVPAGQEQRDSSREGGGDGRVGGGQLGRVDASEMAVKKAGERAGEPSPPATPSSPSPTASRRSPRPERGP